MRECRANDSVHALSVFAERRIAVVHPWVVNVRGGEKVFFEIARALPTADLFVLHCRTERLPSDLRPRLRAVSFLQGPARVVPYRALLPLLPLAASSLDVRAYDLVVSSSFGWAHGVSVAEDAMHVCYMHAPPRYLWGEAPIGGSIVRVALGPLLPPLRRWDLAAARRVDAFIANSGATAERIRDRYGRDARVVHPPVDVGAFATLPASPDGYALCIAELVPYKRIDIAIDAARRLGLELVIVGDGPLRGTLEARARGAKVRFLGRVPDRELIRVVEGAALLVHPAVEDFGIVMVEALASGRPVVARRAGGALELDGMTGVFLVESDASDAFADAMDRARRARFDAASVRAGAASFSNERFRDELLAELRRLIEAR